MQVKETSLVKAAETAFPRHMVYSIQINNADVSQPRQINCKNEKGNNLTLGQLAETGSIKGVIDLSDISSLHQSPDYEVSRITMYQYLVKEYYNKNLIILHFTSGVKDFQTGNLVLQGALTAEIIKNLGFEYSRIIAKTIDITREDKNRLGDIILKELHFSNRESELCYRNGTRYVPSLQAIKPAKAYSRF